MLATLFPSTVAPAALVTNYAHVELTGGNGAWGTYGALRHLIVTAFAEFISIQGIYYWFGSFGMVTVWPPFAAATKRLVPTILTE